MRDSDHGERDNREIDSNIENQSACGQLVFAERELSLHGNPRCVKQVRKREAAL
jgi:hypothetical protein